MDELHEKPVCLVALRTCFSITMMHTSNVFYFQQAHLSVPLPRALHANPKLLKSHQIFLSLLKALGNAATFFWLFDNVSRIDSIFRKLVSPRISSYQQNLYPAWPNNVPVNLNIPTSFFSTLSSFFRSRNKRMILCSSTNY